MRLPNEIMINIIDSIETDDPFLPNDFPETLELRLVSRFFNKELLKALHRSSEIHPSQVDKLLEMHRVHVHPDIKKHELVRHRKRHAATDKNGENVTRRTCFMGIRTSAPAEDELPRPLDLDLIRPYLVCRMERVAEDPCLLSVFMDRSIDLVAEQYHRVLEHDRQRLRERMAASFDVSLLEEGFSDGLFDSLFNEHGLNYWLPLYDAAHLTVYPRPEDNLRLFYIFRLSHIVSQRRNTMWLAKELEPISGLLAHHPETPEYARLFAIDCFNLATKSNSDVLYNDFLVSNTGQLLNGLTLPERIWCAAKQGKQDLCKALVDRSLKEPMFLCVEHSKLRLAICVVAHGLAEAGEETHSGRTLVEEFLKCKDMKEVRKLCENIDPDDVTQVRARMKREHL